LKGNADAQEFFADAPGGLFKGESYVEDLERARGCFRHLKRIFQELEECRAFELLKARPSPPLLPLEAVPGGGKAAVAGRTR